MCFISINTYMFIVYIIPIYTSLHVSGQCDLSFISFFFKSTVNVYESVTVN